VGTWERRWVRSSLQSFEQYKQKSFEQYKQSKNIVCLQAKTLYVPQIIADQTLPRQNFGAEPIVKIMARNQ